MKKEAAVLHPVTHNTFIHYSSLFRIAANITTFMTSLQVKVGLNAENILIELVRDNLWVYL